MNLLSHIIFYKKFIEIKWFQSIELIRKIIFHLMEQLGVRL